MKLAINTQIGENMLDNILSFLFKVFGLVTVVLAPIKATMFAVGFLIVVDFISGVLAASKRGDKITSNGFRHTLTKMLAYQMTILTAFIAETYLIQELPMVKVVVAMIALTEVKSFFENMETITGVNFWSSVLKKFHGNKTFLRKKNREKK